jgi:hypothetical protein
MGWFKGKDSYTKAFEDHRNTDLAIKCVILRFECISQKDFSSFST